MQDKLDLKVEDANAYATLLHNKSVELNNILKETTEMIKSIEGGPWAGDAGNFTVDRFNNVATSFEEIFKDLELYVKFILESIEDYTVLDTDLKQAVDDNIRS